MKGSRCSSHRTSVLVSAISTVVLGVLLLGGSGRLSAQATDIDGLITGDNWLVLGPFSIPDGVACGTDPNAFLLNTVAPSEIACQFPEEDDEIDYDPTQSATTAYIGPTGGTGKPVWRAFSDGVSDGNQNLDADVNGGQTDVMGWLLTYVEYLGASPTLVELCAGSDDGIQVWLDDQLLLSNGTACRAVGTCQDTLAVVITPGTHRIAMGIWENDGGWDGRLGLRQGGVPITDDLGLWPDWSFPGRSGSVNVPNCAPQQPGSRVAGVNCSKRLDGGVDLTWMNPPDADTGVAISIWSEGVQVATVAGTATSASVPGAQLSGPNALVCVVNSSGLGSCCSANVTDAVGLVKSTKWLILGPFNNPFGCNGNNNSILGNHIAPSCIQGQYPVPGQEIEYEPAPRSASTAYVGPLGATGKPVWRAFDDGSDDGDQNFDADAAIGGDHSDVMSWVATYIEYTGAGPIDVTLCAGSDDGIQVWDNDQLAHNNNACRGVVTCNDTPTYTVTPGVHCFKVGAWDRAGGWGIRLGLQVGGLPITDDEAAFPDWTFWGRTKPPGFVDIPCPACLDPVTIVSCRFGSVGFGTGLVVEWTNPPGCDSPLLQSTSISVNGVQVGTVPATASKVGVPSALLPPGTLFVDVVNSSGIPATCCFQKTDDLGLIRTNAWLVLGPFANACGCGSQECIQGNMIAPSHICQQFPAANDEIEYDPAQADSTAYLGPLSTNDKPYWRPLDDGSPCNGDQNFDADSGGPPGDEIDEMSWLATYIEYTGADPILIDLCASSDDGVQLWMDDQLIHSNNACRAIGACQDLIAGVTIDPGVHCFKLGIFERAGGWQGALSLTENSIPIVDDGSRDDFVFHGTQRPAGAQFPSCVVPCNAVTDVICSYNAQRGIDVSWQNPPCDNPPASISIKVNGNEVGTAASNATSFTIPAADVPDGVVEVTVDNGARRPGHCALINGDTLYMNCGGDELTDLLGRVWTRDTLAIPSPFLTGPNAFAADFGNPAGVDVLSDPVVAAEQFPAEIFPLERWNDGPIEYTINGFPTGSYQVTLLFMEGCCSDGCEDIPDPALSAGGCRVFDVYINDLLVDDQFSQNVAASLVAGTVPGVASNYVAVARVYDVDVAGALKIRIEDLGPVPANPPENASIKGICIVPSGPREICNNQIDDDGDTKVDCADESCAAAPNCLGVLFHRGDADGNGSTQLTDAVRILNNLFLGTGVINCSDAADSDDNGGIQLTDAVRVLNVLFLGTGQIPAPGGGPPLDGVCGLDPTADDLDCADYPAANCQ